MIVVCQRGVVSNRNCRGCLVDQIIRTKSPFDGRFFDLIIRVPAYHHPIWSRIGQSSLRVERDIIIQSNSRDGKCKECNECTGACGEKHLSAMGNLRVEQEKTRSCCMSSQGGLQRGDLIAAVYSLGPGGSVSLTVQGVYQEEDRKEEGREVHAGSPYLNRHCYQDRSVCISSLSLSCISLQVFSFH